MRIDIDGKGGPDALHRSRLRKVVGRKHNHQPRGRARERIRQRALARVRKAVEERRMFSALVRAYFKGDIPTYPGATP